MKGTANKSHKKTSKSTSIYKYKNSEVYVLEYVYVLLLTGELSGWECQDID